MTLGCRQVNQAPLAEQIYPAAIVEPVLVDELAHASLRLRALFDDRDVDLIVEVAGVRHDNAVLQSVEVAAVDDVDAAGCRDDDVGDLRGFGHRHDSVAFHDGLERPSRVDLGHDDVRSHAACPHRQTAATPAEPSDHEAASCQQDVGRPDHAIDGALAGPVAIVEKVLGLRFVDRDDRIAEDALLGHALEADDAGGCLFGAAQDLSELVGLSGVEDGHQVCAIVHGDVRPARQGGLDVAVVSLLVLALDREGVDAIFTGQRGRDIVLSRQGVGGAERNLSAPLLQRERQVGSFARHV